MPRPCRIDPLLIKQAQEAAATATSVDLLRQCQAILLPALVGATHEQTATALGVGRATVARLQAGFRRRSAPASKQRFYNWGGRRRSLLSIEEERDFLQPWLEQAKQGAMVVVSPIRAALSHRLKRPVKASVVYRLLSRHGWRKVAPDTRHPKSRPEVQEEWKKNCRRYWTRC